MKNLLIQIGACALLLCQVAPAQQQPSASTVVLVRHAEKVSNAPDAVLSPQGQQRAECLANILKDAGIKRIYVSDAKRTQQTAEPLAKALGIEPVIVPAGDANTLVRNVFYDKGGNALVVGHSNTVPLVIQQVQAGTVPPIGENEYDGLYVLTMLEGSSTPAVKLHYCAPSPHSAAPASMEPPVEEKPKPPAKKK
ncbi:MAG TPA: phosphoglycerate mutase family protein [Candidatus Sulfotelmatobacter sp.]|jgi:phosphohistidine phosphatase SixA|nr:phosphoglycerate mutase family protein [Candidatus Sulfotelmatobacter sp.]